MIKWTKFPDDDVWSYFNWRLIKRGERWQLSCVGKRVYKDNFAYSDNQGPFDWAEGIIKRVGDENNKPEFVFFFLSVDGSDKQVCGMPIGLEKVLPSDEFDVERFAPDVIVKICRAHSRSGPKFTEHKVIRSDFQHDAGGVLGLLVLVGEAIKEAQK